VAAAIAPLLTAAAPLPARPRSQVDELDGSQAGLRRERADLLAQLGAKETELGALRGQLDGARTELDGLQHKLDKVGSGETLAAGPGRAQACGSSWAVC
jgi:uncharacterized protein involved in exopolysaccharide biosynthesis